MVEDFKRGDEPEHRGVAATVEEFKSILRGNPDHPNAEWMRERIAEFELLKAVGSKLAGD